MNELVVIKSSDIQTDIAIMKTYLEDKGIPCFLKDDIVSSIYPVGLGGVKLQLFEKDALQAAELLIEGGFAKKEDFEIPESTMRMVRIYEKISNFFRGK